MTATTTEPAPDEVEAPDAADGDGDARGGSVTPRWLRYLVVPGLVAIACGAMYVYVQSRELDSIEARLLTGRNIRRFAIDQIEISLLATALILLIAIPLGIALTRPWARRIAPYVVAVANSGQGMPALGLVVLVFILFVRQGRNATVLALVIYGILPVLRGTMVGLQQVDRGVIKAARGMGMSKTSVLLRIELPLAVPILLTGVRTALVLTVATSVLGGFIGAGTYGQLIIGGFAQTRLLAVAVGSVAAASMAILADWLGGIAEDVLRPKGL